MLSDITVILGSLDFVMGECDHDLLTMENTLNLSDDTLSQIDEVIPKYPEKRSAALMVIHLVQNEIGAVNDAACEWIAEKLELNPINIKELITFYPMLREKPWGKKTYSCLPNFTLCTSRVLWYLQTLEENSVLKRDMSGRMVSFHWNLWNASQIAGRVRW